MDGDTAKSGTNLQPTMPMESELDDSTADTTAGTPWRTLHQLANLPRTPLRRASSAGPPSTHRSQRRTPAARTPAANQRYGSARRPIALTPHGRAAQRELNIRRAGLTPGKDRFRPQRETPRNDLRALSRLLAPKSKPIERTPEVAGGAQTKSIHGQDDWDDGPEIERPRLSLPVGDYDEDDDSLMLPPKSAGLEDADITLQSLEYGRRAISEQPLSRLSRGSFGTIRMSDGFGDDSRLNDASEAFDLSVFPTGRGEVSFLNDDDALQGENTGVLRGLGLDRVRLSFASGRGSDIRPSAVSDDDTDFVLNVPPRDASDIPPTPTFQIEDFLGAIDDDVDAIEEEDASEEEGDDVATVEPQDEDDHEEPTDRDETQVNPIIEHLEGESRIEAAQDLEAGNLHQLKKMPRKKKVKVSRHGIEYPSLPAGVVKKLATAFARTAGNSKAKISKDTLDAVMQASDWFFEQASEDLSAYATHAGRKTIDESDVITLMTRQRQTNSTTTPFSLAQKHLPRELLQELRMAPPSKY